MLLNAMSENHYTHIGELLRTAREDHGLSIEETGRQLHIRMRYLRSLEAGAMDELPGYPYVKGYLKSYAEFLNLDAIEIMRRFEMAEQSAHQPRFFLPQTFSSDKQASPIFVWAGLLMASVILLFWALFWRAPVGEISLVEKLPEPIMQPAPKPKLAPKPACFNEAEKPYPPCYWPKPAPPKSIMLEWHRLQP